MNRFWICVVSSNGTSNFDRSCSIGWQINECLNVFSYKLEVASGVVVYIHTNNIFFAVFNFSFIGPVVARSTTSVFRSTYEVELVTDFFVVINSAFNDYRDLFGDDLSNYVKFTDEFINDEDAKKGKVFKYFTTIVK
jgi:hypothetical protein